MCCNIWILQFLYVKSYPRILVFPIPLQPQMYCHHYKIVITSYISARKSSWCQDVVDLVVCFAVRRMPSCSPGSLVWIQCDCCGKVFTACKFYHSFVLPHPKFADCSCPVFICIFTYLCIPVADDYILLPCSRYCLFECLIEHFSFFVALRCGWGISCGLLLLMFLPRLSTVFLLGQQCPTCIVIVHA